MVISKYKEFLSTLEARDRNILVFTPNPEIFVRASEDKEFFEILEKATYNVPDGVGLYLGYELSKGKGIQEAWKSFMLQREELVKKY